MARWGEPTAEQVEGYRQWCASRPEAVRKVAERFEPWSVYRLKNTSSVVTVVSFNEGEDDTVTVTVNITDQFNDFNLFDRQLFGINPDDLEPCELPATIGLGSMMTTEEVRDNLDALRVLARPDLWELDNDGKAVRKRCGALMEILLGEIRRESD